MSYMEAIFICENIDKQDLEIDDEQRIIAIEKILSMATINAVKKDTLLKVIRWFFDNCVEVETSKEEADNDQN